MKPPQQLHIPVLFDDVIRLLHPKKGERYLDLTAGYGGHARAVITQIGNAKDATLVDRDTFATSFLQENLPGARLIQSDFFAAAENLARADERFDMILLDLGVSSPQLDIAERGFSFNADAPLDMRMDQSQGVTAADIVNRWPESTLAEIIRDFGEETPNQSAKIAHAIVRARGIGRIETTVELADVVARTVGYGRTKSSSHVKKKIHPATRTFQAIRIAVNDELGQLTQTLPLILQLLNDGGRVAIISFHSLEDRLVKEFFRDNSAEYVDGTFEILTKKPISGLTNDVTNPRARSAKLRAACKINKRKDL
jgi:16S rRNA (cytosine1402-N4)-methyltransferase